MATPIITIKLMVDKKSNKLIFAEASKDFVDLLFFLLSLPIGTAIKLLASKSMVGSFANIYTSFSNLTSKQGNVSLNPMKISPFVIGLPVITSGNFHTCLNSKCNLAIITNGVDNCPRCSKMMHREIKVVGASDTAASPSSSKQGFGEETLVFYIISDDLSVKMSAQSIISVLDMLEVREVKVGNEEGLQLLKASFHSKTVLTDVFLRKIEK